MVLSTCGGQEEPSVASATDTLVADAANQDSGTPAQVFSRSGGRRLESLDPEDPLAVFMLDEPTRADTAARRISLRLVNAASSPLAVFAEAGAGRVAVDTIAPGDSVLVDLETRADSVLVSAATLGGQPRGVRQVRPGTSPQRLVFP